MLKFIVLLLLLTWTFSRKETPETDATAGQTARAETSCEPSAETSCQPTAETWRAAMPAGKAAGDDPAMTPAEPRPVPPAETRPAAPARKFSAPVYTIVRKSNHHDRHRH